MQDSTTVSLLIGRYGVMAMTALALIAGMLGYNVDETDKKFILEAITTGATLIAGVQAVISKVRSTKK